MVLAESRERGGASILVLGVLVGAAFLIAILAAVGSAYVAHAELQQAADLAATTLEQAPGDAPRERAMALARANGARGVEVESDGSELHVTVTGRAPRMFGLSIGSTIEAEAWATIPPPGSFGDAGPNPPGVYAGPLVTVDGVQVCPRVGAAYRAMDAAAARDGITLTPTSGFRGWAEQAILYAQLGPGLAAPPGASRHHDGTELDINVGPAGSPVHQWLRDHGPAHGFHQRYSWEPWHWGFVAGCDEPRPIALPELRISMPAKNARLRRVDDEPTE